MKKEVFVLVFIFAFLISNVALVLSDEQEDVQKAYDCLHDKVDDKCSTLSLQNQIFSLLSINECKAELVDSSKDETCWPSSSCDVKTTAQAVLALSKTGFDFENSVSWLMDQKMAPSDLDWYLQIDAEGENSFTINFEGGSYQLTINEDKQITDAIGECFTKAQDGYWLKILGACQDKEFEISCDSDCTFLTNLLYKEKDSNVFYVSEDTSSASGSSSTTEKVNAFCLEKNHNCDYEATLWATLTLKYLGYDSDASSFVPYLVSKAQDNQKYIPDSFLYYITDYAEFRSALLSKQKFNKYWKGADSNNEYYDTAVALFSLIGENPTEKTKAQDWLLSTQGDNGCWQNDIKTTEFLLYSAWPEYLPNQPECFEDDECNEDEKCIVGRCVVPYSECDTTDECDSGEVCIDSYCVGVGNICVNNSDCVSGSVCLNERCTLIGGGCVDDNECDEGEECFEATCTPVEAIDCEDAGYSCRSRTDCSDDGGSILDYDCNIPNKCCTIAEKEKTCSELDGEICNSNQNCVGGTKITSASDLGLSESCCIGGICQDKGSELSDCEFYGGTCRDSCLSSESTSSDPCTNSFDLCCIRGGESGGSSYTWVWILIILIVLVVLGILFKDQLRLFFLKIKSKFGGSKSSGPRGPPRPKFPPSTGAIMNRRPIPRKILPRQNLPSRPAPRKPLPKKNDELDEVLKKLKDMGK